MSSNDFPKRSPAGAPASAADTSASAITDSQPDGSERSGNADLLEQQGVARLDRYRRRKKALREVNEILREAGLEGDALACLTARQLARLETLASELEPEIYRRGPRDAKGNLKETTQTFVSLVQSLLDRALRLLERIQDLRGTGTKRGPDVVTYRVALAQVDGGQDVPLFESEAGPDADLPASVDSGGQVGNEEGGPDGTA